MQGGKRTRYPFALILIIAWEQDRIKRVEVACGILPFKVYNAAASATRKLDGERFQVGAATDFNARVKEKRIVYDFFIPCTVEAGDAARSVRFQVQDPEIFVSGNETLTLPRH